MTFSVILYMGMNKCFYFFVSKLSQISKINCQIKNMTHSLQKKSKTPFCLFFSSVNAQTATVKSGSSCECPAIPWSEHLHCTWQIYHCGQLLCCDRCGLGFTDRIKYSSHIYQFGLSKCIMKRDLTSFVIVWCRLLNDSCIFC